MSTYNCEFPGIIETNIRLAANNTERKGFKISIDGKKISGGFGKSLGDVDLVGHEEKPTLQEEKTIYKGSSILFCHVIHPFLSYKQRVMKLMQTDRDNNVYRVCMELIISQRLKSMRPMKVQKAWDWNI